MMRLTTLLLLVLSVTTFMLAPGFSYAQETVKVKGRVVEAKDKTPLAGATIKQVNGNKNAVADAEGKFEIELPVKSKITVSMVGYASQTFTISGKEIVIELENRNANLDEVVVIGYGTQKKSKLTSSVASIKASEISSIPTTNLSNSLQGRLSGTYVQTASGVPGLGSGMRVRINTSPNPAPIVYVIDGVVRDEVSFNALDPNEVDEITVLKDAASAAIYGSRSSNGVILVTTKKGKSGKAVITFSSILSTERFTQLPEYLEAGKGMDIINSVYNNISPEEREWVIKNNPKQRNYFDAAYKNPNNQRYALSASGGNENITYYIGGSYAKQNGFLNNLNYGKYNLRGNIQAKLTKRLTAGLNLSTSFGTFNSFSYAPTGSNGENQEMYRFLLYFDPWLPASIDGKLVDVAWIGNPLALINNSGYRKNTNQQIDALMTLEYKVPGIKGLTAKASFSKNFDNNFTKEFAKKALLYTFKKTGANSRIYTNEVIGTAYTAFPPEEFVSNSFARNNSYQLNTQLNYERTFGKHDIDAVAIYEQYERFDNSFNGSRRGFSLFPIDQFFGTVNNNLNWSVNGREEQFARLGYIGRVNYSYDDKYLLTASIRRDGSTIFAPDQRWGNFYSVSGGWVISRENFFRNAGGLDFISFLKLRASFAQTGNDGIPGWQWMEKYNISSSSYYMGANGFTAPRLTYGGIPIFQYTWETSNTVNVAMDMQLFKGLSFSVDFWKRHTYDILGGRVLAVPVEYGGSLPPENYAIVDAKGAEFELDYKGRFGNGFTYGVKANFALADNKIIKYDVAANAQAVDNPNGKSMYRGVGYKTAGIFRTQDDLTKLPAGYTIFGATPQLGMMNFQDLSGPNKTPDGKIDGYDRVVLGNHFGTGGARETYGLLLNFGWKGLNLEMFFSGLTGFKIAYDDPWGKQLSGGNMIVKYHDDAWSPENPNGKHPKLFPWGSAEANGYVQVSDFNTYKAGFIRMKNLNLSYTIPAKYSQRVNISNARIFVGATNLFYLSQFKLYDPELYGFGAYPFSKSYSVGIDIKL